MKKIISLSLCICLMAINAVPLSARENDKRSEEKTIKTNFTYAVGIVANVLVLAGFVPQVHKTYTTQKVDDLSLPFLGMIFVGNVLYTVYGFLIDDIIIWAGTAVGDLMLGYLVYAKWKFGRSGFAPVE